MTKTQEQIEREIAKLNEKLNIIKQLREFGITKNDAEKFIDNIPTISSGYSMGEYVQVALINKDIRCGIFLTEIIPLMQSLVSGSQHTEK